MYAVLYIKRFKVLLLIAFCMVQPVDVSNIEQNTIMFKVSSGNIYIVKRTCSLGFVFNINLFQLEPWRGLQKHTH